MEGLGKNLTADADLIRDSGAVGEGQSGRMLFATMKDARGFMPGDFVLLSVTEPLQNYVVKLPASAINANSEVLLLTTKDRLETLEVELVRRQGNEILVRSRDLANREVQIADEGEERCVARV